MEGCKNKKRIQFLKSNSCYCNIKTIAIYLGKKSDSMKIIMAAGIVSGIKQIIP